MNIDHVAKYIADFFLNNEYLIRLISLYGEFLFGF